MLFHLCVNSLSHWAGYNEILNCVLHGVDSVLLHRGRRGGAAEIILVIKNERLLDETSVILKNGCAHYLADES